MINPCGVNDQLVENFYFAINGVAKLKARSEVSSQKFSKLDF